MERSSFTKTVYYTTCGAFLAVSFIPFYNCPSFATSTTTTFTTSCLKAINVRQDDNPESSYPTRPANDNIGTVHNAPRTTYTTSTTTTLPL